MTPNEITALPPHSILWDQGQPGSVSGLHVKSHSEGVKSFYLYYRTRAGQQRRPKIGAWPETTLSEARRRAKILKERIALGEDPSGDWENKRKEMTVLEVFELAMAKHWSKSQYQKSRWAYEVERNFENNIMPHFAHTKISDLTPLKIRNWHESMADRPYAANRSLDVLSKIFNFAIEQELRPQGTNPCLLVKSFEEKSRSRIATREEMTAILEAIERHHAKTPVAATYLYALVYSGARPQSLENLRWDHIKDGIAFLKNKGADAKIVFPADVLTRMKALKRRPDEKVFGIKMPRQLWAKIMRETGIEGLWVRDLRRSFASFALQNGVPIDKIGELLNHKSAQTTKVYARLLDQSRTETTEFIAAKIRGE